MLNINIYYVALQICLWMIIQKYHRQYCLILMIHVQNNTTWYQLKLNNIAVAWTRVTNYCSRFIFYYFYLSVLFRFFLLFFFVFIFLFSYLTVIFHVFPLVFLNTIVNILILFSFSSNRWLRMKITNKALLDMMNQINMVTYLCINTLYKILLHISLIFLYETVFIVIIFSCIYITMKLNIIIQLSMDGLMRFLKLILSLFHLIIGRDFIWCVKFIQNMLTFKKKIGIKR